MSNEFDPAEFDAPVTPPDHTVLLDAIRGAATSGVRAGIDPLFQTLNQLTQQVSDLRKAEADLASADHALKRAQASLFWDNAKYALVYAAAAGLILSGAGAGYWMVKKPKVTTEYLGCSSWNAKKGSCEAKWIPLKPVEGARDAL